MNSLFVIGSTIIFCLLSFQQAYVHSGVKRAFLGAYKGVAEVAVVAYNLEGNSIIPYFSKSLFEKAVSDYFASCLCQYVQEYALDFDYLYREGQLGLAEGCYAASFNLKCSLLMMGSFDESASFYLRESNNE